LHASTLASCLSDAYSLFVGPRGVFWSTGGPNWCQTIDARGGGISQLAPGSTSPTQVVQGVTAPSDLYVDGSTLYYSITSDVSGSLTAATASL
jgi:hypothetical protein